MLKSLKSVFILLITFALSTCLVACGTTTEKVSSAVSEKIELANATLSDVEFENSDTVRLTKNGNEYVVLGTITAMSDSQKNTFNSSDTTHIVSLKFVFDKEKTISTFKIEGKTKKVFSTDSSVENYAGSITDLLDSDEGEDAYSYLILSANTKNYTLTSTYSDRTTSVINLKIDATLATSTLD